jgi:hypothetical protein
MGSFWEQPEREVLQADLCGKKQLDEEWATWKRFSDAIELILRDA